MNPPRPVVVAVVAAYQRPEELRRLLASLEAPANPVALVVVVDNGRNPATRAVTESASVPVRYLDPGTNLSCGGGVKRGLQEGLTLPEATHFWILDDDALAHPGSLQILVETMQQTGAAAAVPAVIDAEGRLNWSPGLVEPGPLAAVRSRLTPAEYLAQIGPRPVPFTWAPWPSLLLTRHAVETIGFPRDDFWITAEDLEYALRITAGAEGLFVPAATCAHLPPHSEVIRQQHYIKFCCMLQNLAYVTFHLPHGRRVRRNLPGNFWRFWRTFGFTRIGLADAAKAFWWGAVRKKPAGHAGFDEFRTRYFAAKRP